MANNSPQTPQKGRKKTVTGSPYTDLSFSSPSSTEGTASTADLAASSFTNITSSPGDKDLPLGLGLGLDNVRPKSGSCEKTIRSLVHNTQLFVNGEVDLAGFDTILTATIGDPNERHTVRNIVEATIKAVATITRRERDGDNQNLQSRLDDLGAKLTEEKNKVARVEGEKTKAVSAADQAEQDSSKQKELRKQAEALLAAKKTECAKERERFEKYLTLANQATERKESEVQGLQQKLDKALKEQGEHIEYVRLQEEQFDEMQKRLYGCLAHFGVVDNNYLEIGPQMASNWEEKAKEVTRNKKELETLKTQNNQLQESVTDLQMKVKEIVRLQQQNDELLKINTQVEDRVRELKFKLEKSTHHKQPEDGADSSVKTGISAADEGLHEFTGSDDGSERFSDEERDPTPEDDAALERKSTSEDADESAKAMEAKTEELEDLKQNNAQLDAKIKALEATEKELEDLKKQNADLTIKELDEQVRKHTETIDQLKTEKSKTVEAEEYKCRALNQWQQDQAAELQSSNEEAKERLKNAEKNAEAEKTKAKALQEKCEALEAQSKADDAMGKRVDQLKKQLETLRNVLENKDQQIAEMRKAAETNKSDPEELRKAQEMQQNFREDSNTLRQQLDQKKLVVDRASAREQELEKQITKASEQLKEASDHKTQLTTAREQLRQVQYDQQKMQEEKETLEAEDAAAAEGEKIYVEKTKAFAAKAARDDHIIAGRDSDMAKLQGELDLSREAVRQRDERIATLDEQINEFADDIARLNGEIDDHQEQIERVTEAGMAELKKLREGKESNRLQMRLLLDEIEHEKEAMANVDRLEEQLPNAQWSEREHRMYVEKLLRDINVLKQSNRTYGVNQNDDGDPITDGARDRVQGLQAQLRDLGRVLQETIAFRRADNERVQTAEARVRELERLTPVERERCRTQETLNALLTRGADIGRGRNRGRGVRGTNAGTHNPGPTRCQPFWGWGPLEEHEVPKTWRDIVNDLRRRGPNTQRFWLVVTVMAFASFLIMAIIEGHKWTQWQAANGFSRAMYIDTDNPYVCLGMPRWDYFRDFMEPPARMPLCPLGSLGSRRDGSDGER